MRRDVRRSCRQITSSRAWRWASSHASGDMRVRSRPCASRRGVSTTHRTLSPQLPACFASTCTVLARLLRPAPDADGVSDSVLTLTAIILLLRPLDVWWLAPFVLAAACLSLALRAVRRAPLTWIVVATLAGARIVAVWPLSDNHIYLLGYWCLAIGLALSTAASAATLSASSRWLLAAAFVMAVLWKAVLSPDYTDGRFFRVTLLTDDRFADAALVFGGLSREQMAQNRAFREPLPEGAALLDPPAFVEPPRLRVFARIAT